MKKKVLQAFFVCVILLSLQVTASAFSDVPENHWAKSYITEMTNEGILSGYSDGTFRPDNTMTRAEFAVTLVRIAGWELSDENSPYADVNNHWAKRYIVTASFCIDGISDALFEPDAPATREVVASVLGSLHGWLMTDIDTDAAQSKFSDFGESDPKFQEDIIRAIKLGITSGYPDGTFRPKAHLTRAAVCAFVYRAFRYEINTIASNLYDFRSLVIDDSGVTYYIDGNTIYNTSSEKTLDLSTSFGTPLSNPYLAYDPYQDIVYLLAGGDLTIYDITDFDAPSLVLDKSNCPALVSSGAGKLEYCSSVTPQIAVVENGALLIPFDTNGTWMVNPEHMTVTKTSRLYSFSYQNQYAKLLGDLVVFFNQSRPQMATIIPLGSDEELTISIPGTPWNNVNSVISRNGIIYFYSPSNGVYGYGMGENGLNLYCLIEQEHIRIKDYYNLDNPNIWCLDAGENDYIVFYDNSLKCIRCIHHAS